MSEATDYKKHWTGIVILLGVFLVVINLVETNLVLNQFISPPLNIKLEDWLVYYQIIAYSGLGISILTVGFWYYWGTNLVKVYTGSDLQKATGRWWQLFGCLAIVFLVSLFLTSAQEGVWIADLFYVINILGFYYLATVWFSPVSVMDCPPGATKLRFIR